MASHTLINVCHTCRVNRDPNTPLPDPVSIDELQPSVALYAQQHSGRAPQMPFPGYASSPGATKSASEGEDTGELFSDR